MSTTSSGQFAEKRAAEYLEQQGYSVLARNWKRQSAEIDIVARRGRTIYFVEVKYRATDHFGGGLEYIARQKLHHMERAAALWAVEYNYDGERQLAAIEVAGDTFEITDFIDSVF